MNLFNGAVFIPEGATGRRQGLSLQLLRKVITRYCDINPRQLLFPVETTVEPLLWDTPIQGTHNLVLHKCSPNLRIYHLY